MDDRMLHQEVGACVDAFREEVHQCIDQVGLLSYGLVFLELEKQLFGLLMRLGAVLVAVFLEGVHRKRDWIDSCQAQARESAPAYAGGMALHGGLLPFRRSPSYPHPLCSL